MGHRFRLGDIRLRHHNPHHQNSQHIHKMTEIKDTGLVVATLTGDIHRLMRAKKARDGSVDVGSDLLIPGIDTPHSPPSEVILVSSDDETTWGDSTWGDSTWGDSTWGEEMADDEFTEDMY